MLIQNALAAVVIYESGCQEFASMSHTLRNCLVSLFCVSLLLGIGCQRDAEQEQSNQEQTNNPSKENGSTMNLEKTSYGKLSDDREVDLYTCTNANGLVVKLITYGAIVTSVEVPDRDGKLANITLGFDSLDGYLPRHPYFGATVGRYCNRIAKGKFKLGDQEYTLATNNDPNHLHGGENGFDRVLWDAEPVQTESAVGVKFHYVSKNGEEGYPGNLDVTATYLLTNDNELSVEFMATTDQPTPVNLTNHNYWNLSGAGSGAILNHELEIAADQFLAVDDTLIPTGEMVDVAGSFLDFTKAQKIGARIEESKLKPLGYDHCFALRSQDGSMAFAARVTDAASGRVMEIETTQPGLQFYSGNFLDGSEGGGGNKQHEAFCLETQHYPDSPNQPGFPTTILKPGETYQQKTVHKFSVK
jgi:aldose 1-epimerase